MQVRNIAAASQLLEFSEVVASRRLAEQLQVEIGHPLYRLVILRFANRVPVLLERVFIPCSLSPNLEEWDLEKNAIIDLLVNVYALKLSRISQTFEAVAAEETISRQLRIEDGYPLLMLTRILYDADQVSRCLLSKFSAATLPVSIPG
jgi:GntR family transcriptional regulator